MEFIIDKDILNRTIAEVSKAISNKPSLPVMSGIKIVATSEKLTLVGCNTEIIIQKIIPLGFDGKKVLEIIEPGSIVVSAKHLSEISKKLARQIHFKVKEDQSITIQSENILVTLKGFRAEDYPAIPEFEQTNYVSISSEDLIKIIKQTTFAASRNYSRPVLTGLNISFSEEQLICAATNSQRLALRKHLITSNLEASITVPASNLNELIKLIQDETNNIKIHLLKRLVIFELGNLLFYSHLLEGIYPDVLGLLPNDSNTKIVLNTKQFLTGIDRACLFSKERRNNNVYIEIINGNSIKISSQGLDNGEIEEIQFIKKIEGEQNLKIAFDASYLIDALREIDEEEIRMSFRDSVRPVLIEPINNSTYIQLISPLRT